MKIALIFASLVCAFLLSSCADQSLTTDEDYARRPPGPYSPDPMQHVPDPSTYGQRPGY